MDKEKIIADASAEMLSEIGAMSAKVGDALATGMQGMVDDVAKAFSEGLENIKKVVDSAEKRMKSANQSDAEVPENPFGPKETKGE